MKKTFLIISLFFTMLSPVLAVKIKNLYQAEISVTSQAYEVREQAVKDGLLQVLIKISGNPMIEQNPVIKTGLKKADYFVQEYSYSSDSTAASQYQLRITYEPNDVNRLLAKAKVSQWGENRPLILIWLTVMDKHHITSIIGNDMASTTVFDKMLQEGKQYGLPLIFPVMDVDDMNHVAAKDIAGLNMPALLAASKRYAPDGLLVGEIEENDQGSQSSWHLMLKNKTWTWKIENETIDNLVILAINQVRQALSDARIDRSHQETAN